MLKLFIGKKSRFKNILEKELKNGLLINPFEILDYMSISSPFKDITTTIKWLKQINKHDKTVLLRNVTSPIIVEYDMMVWFSIDGVINDFYKTSWKLFLIEFKELYAWWIHNRSSIANGVAFTNSQFLDPYIINMVNIIKEVHVANKTKGKNSYTIF